MNKLKTPQKLALAVVTMLYLSLDETACPRSIKESIHWRPTPLTHKLLIDVLHCLPLNLISYSSNQIKSNQDLFIVGIMSNII